MTPLLPQHPGRKAVRQSSYLRYVIFSDTKSDCNVQGLSIQCSSGNYLPRNCVQLGSKVQKRKHWECLFHKYSMIARTMARMRIYPAIFITLIQSGSTWFSAFSLALPLVWPILSPETNILFSYCPPTCYLPMDGPT